MDKKNEKIIARNEDFAKWYTSIINEAKLIQYYDIKGFMIYQPYGWAIWENIKSILNSKFRNIGVQDLYMPMLIMESEFEKEKEHVEGFSPELFKIKHIGDKELSETLCIRPTSEIVFCNYWKNILKSYKDLPFLHNQWVNVFRAEKSTKPFLRNSEFHWHELHCCYETKQEAINQAKLILNIYEEFISKNLDIPCIKGEKTPGERFAGAVNTYTIETIMQDKQALQTATSHFLGQNFTRPYQVQFQDKNNKFSVPYSTSHGLSTRTIGSIIMVHSDDNGLVLPFDIAPNQISIAPLFANKFPELDKIAEEINDKLSKKYRTNIINEDKSLGYIIAQQQVLGVPFTIIFGKKDIDDNSVTIFRRDTNQKQVIKLNNLDQYFINESIKYKNNLYNKALQNNSNVIKNATTYQELAQIVNNGDWALAFFEGSIDDEKKIKSDLGITPRCIVDNNDNKVGKCIITNKDTKQLVLFARAY